MFEKLNSSESFPFSFWLLFIQSFLSYFAVFQLFPTVPLILRELGASLAESGIFITFFTIGAGVGAMVLGPLSDYLGYRRIIVISALSFGVIIVIEGILLNSWTFYVLAPIQGFLWSGVMTATMAKVVELIAPHKRIQGLAIFGLAAPLGFMVGPIAGLWLYLNEGFKLLSVVMAAIFVTVSVMGLFLPHDKLRIKRFIRLYPTIEVLDLAIIAFVADLAYGVLETYTAQEGIALNFTIPSAFLSSMALGTLIVRIAAVIFNQRLLNRKLSFTGAILLAFTGLLILTLPYGGMTRHLVAGFLFGGGYSLMFTLLYVVTSERVSKGRQGSAFGTTIFAAEIGIGMGSFGFGWIIDVAGFQWGWRMATTMILCTLPLTLYMLNREGK